jgi:hypothetical protein
MAGIELTPASSAIARMVMREPAGRELSRMRFRISSYAFSVADLFSSVVSSTSTPYLNRPTFLLSIVAADLSTSC